MSNAVKPKVQKQPLRIPGYGQGIWWLMAASALVLCTLFMIESNRAISGSIGFGPQVEVERIPAEEARRIGISPHKR